MRLTAFFFVGLLSIGCADSPTAPSIPEPAPIPSNPLPEEPRPLPKVDPPPTPKPDFPAPRAGVYGRPVQFGWFFVTFYPGQHPQTGTQACAGSIQVVADEADGTYPFNPGLPIIATAQAPFGGAPSYLKTDPQYVLLEADSGGRLLGDHAGALSWARAHGREVLVYYDAGGPPPSYLVGLADIFALQAYPDRSETPEQSVGRITRNLEQFGGPVAIVRGLYTRNGTVSVDHVLRFNELLTGVIRDTRANVVMDLAFSCARTSGALDHPRLLDYGRYLADAAARGL